MDSIKNFVKITAKFCCHLQHIASTRWTVHWQTLTYRLRPSTRCSQLPPKQLSKLTVCFILMTREIILSNVEEVGSEEYLVVYRDTAISCRKSVVSLVLTIQFSKCPGLSFHGVIVSSLLPAHLLSQWSCSWNWSVAETGNINPYFTACLWSKLGIPRVYILCIIILRAGSWI